jgi:hypothetical protein
MLNVSFKIFTKVINRLSLVVSKVIGPSQSAFLPGRNILEGVVVLHEALHELRRKKQKGVILKLDFEKAYDKVNWNFLQQLLRLKDFSGKWFQCIENIVTSGCVSVKVNDETGPFFRLGRG